MYTNKNKGVFMKFKSKINNGKLYRGGVPHFLESEKGQVIYISSSNGSSFSDMVAKGVGVFPQMVPRCWANASAVSSVLMSCPVLSSRWYGCGS